jgi:hypothetical protein
MLEPVFRTVEQLVLEFSWKRVLHVLLILMLALAILGALEWYTSYLQLMRIARSAEILATLQEIQSRGLASQSELDQTYRTLMAELEASTYSRTLSWRVPEAPTIRDFRPLWKFSAGAAPMWLIGLFTSFFIETRREAVVTMAAMLLVGLFFGGIGLILPTVAWPWVNLVAYPIGYVLVLAGFGMLISDKEDSLNSAITEAYERGDTSVM